MEKDTELLRRYNERHSEEAFAGLVHRHLPLVYSAALRQANGDVHRAQDVSQAVFTTLAKKAADLQAHPVLTAWLYTTTHFIAARTSRTEKRRQLREQAAFAMQAPPDEPSADWDRLRPTIDHAMLQLSERDRRAVLLRFFENRAFAEIGEQLGINENTARMRVERALDSLHVALTRQGIKSTAGALGALLAGQAVTSAPAALGSAIVEGAVTAGVGTTLSIFMTTSTFKTCLVGTVLVAGATGLFLQNKANTGLHAEIDRLKAQSQLNSQLVSENGRLAAEAAALREDESQLDQVRAQLAASKPDASASAANSWLARVRELKDRVAQSPGLYIPELQLASEVDWLDAAKDNLSTDKDYRQALAKLRHNVTMKFAGQARGALAKYLAHNSGAFPAQPAQLQPFFEDPMDGTILQRYEIVPSSTVKNMKMGGEWIITQKSAVDEEYDLRTVIGPRGVGTTSYPPAGAQALEEVTKNFANANSGTRPKDPGELLPYAKTQEQQAAVQKAMAVPVK